MYLCIMKSGIYKITINGKIYIGSATNLVNRKHRHLHDLRKNKHTNNKLQNAYNKHSELLFSFEIMEYTNIELLIEREQYFIDKLNPFLNICKIAGSSLGRKHSKNTKEYLSKIKKGKQPSLGRVMSVETKSKIGIKAKERGVSENFINASKIANLGKVHTKEHIANRIKKQVKLSSSEVAEIRVLLSEKVNQYQIANTYKVSQRVISKIKNNIGIYETL